MRLEESCISQIVFVVINISQGKFIVHNRKYIQKLSAQVNKYIQYNTVNIQYKEKRVKQIQMYGDEAGGVGVCH